jgi:hypothetical protein
MTIIHIQDDACHPECQDNARSHEEIEPWAAPKPKKPPATSESSKPQRLASAATGSTA